MAEKRQLELHLVRFLPHALRDDFVTVGVLLTETDGGFAELRFTRDWKMLQCVAPDMELEWFELVEREIRGRLGELRRREELLQMISERFGTMLDVAPTKAVLTEDPVKEMDVLADIYLASRRAAVPARQERTGRAAILNTMREAFAEAGVLELMQRDLDLKKYTGAGDPFRFDFGYRIGDSLKMFHAVPAKGDHARVLNLGYRFSRIVEGMRQERSQASLTAVFDQTVLVEDENMRFAMRMLQEQAVRVRGVSEMGEIAGEVRRELLG